jgi:hypothetical protein
MQMNGRLHAAAALGLPQEKMPHSRDDKNTVKQITNLARC